MQRYVAKQGDRLDNIFARFYADSALAESGQSKNNYTTGYNAFILANIYLIDLPVLQGGEIVNLPQLSAESSENEIIGIWE